VFWREAGGWTTVGEDTEAGTDTRACDAGEAATGATANDGVAVVGSDCTTACRDRDLVRRRSQIGQKNKIIRRWARCMLRSVLRMLIRR